MNFSHTHSCAFYNHKWTITTQLIYLAYFNDITARKRFLYSLCKGASHPENK